MRTFDHEWLIRSADFATTDFAALEEYLKKHPSMLLRIYGHDGVLDLEFLKALSMLKHFGCNVWSIESFDGLRHLSTELQTLGLGQTRKTLSLRMLDRFANLEELTLERHKNDIDALGSLPKLRQLSLASISLHGLSCLLPLKDLASLWITQGGTKDLSLLPELGNLKSLGLRAVTGLSDITAVAQMGALEYLHLEELKHVTRLPRLSELKRLRRIHLETMSGITDLSPLIEAENMEELAIFNTHLAPEQFSVLKDHPRLKAISVGLGTRTKNEEVESMLGLPRLAHPGIIGMPSDATSRH